MERPKKTPRKCKARQELDEKVCWHCGGLRWPADEPVPETPAAKCRQRKEKTV